ncbi:MAG: Nif11-like leader peptide family natural product precursor [Chlorobiaceae bacterium]|nr:Nif11-like leader peptide family natural product precursor [Chlorobiaceae bacterium]
MSIEAAKACIGKMKSDESFRETIMSLKDTDARLKAIRDAGFTCTAEELLQISSEIDPSDIVAGNFGMSVVNIMIC